MHIRFKSHILLIFALAALSPGKSKAAESRNAQAIQVQYSLNQNESLFVHSSFGNAELEHGLLTPDALHSIRALYEQTHEPVLFFEIEKSSNSGREPSSAESDPGSLEPIKRQLESESIPTETVQLSQSDAQGLDNTFTKIKKTIKGAYIKPEANEIKLGAISTFYRLGVASYVWFAAVNVSLETAVTLTLFQTTLTALFNIYGRTADKLFSSRFMKGDYLASAANLFARRQLFGLLITELIALGAVGHAHLFSVESQARILANSLIMGTGDAIFASVRAQTYQNNPTVYSRLGFLAFATLTPIGMLDLLGVGGPAVLDVGFYQLKVSALAMISVYAGMIVSMKAAPQKLEALLALPAKLLAPFKAAKEKLVNTKFISACARLLKRGKRTSFLIHRELQFVV